MATKNMNLHQKLVEIRRNIASLQKDGSSYGYTYVKGEQILAKIKDKMDELEVLLIPEVKDQKHEVHNYTIWDKTAKVEKPKTDFLVTGTMKYVWMNAENPEETLEIPWQMMGQQDDLSKAFGSGLTYSERYFLLKFFGVPTDGDDPDTSDNTSRAKGGVSTKANQSSTPASDKQRKFVGRLLGDMQKKHGLTEEKACAVLRQRIGMKGKTLADITKAEATKAIDYLQSDKKEMDQGDQQKESNNDNYIPFPSDNDIPFETSNQQSVN